jgi:CrcB protein
MRSTLIVFIGSGIGGALRHLVNLVSLRMGGLDFPYGTLTINVAGSALMGLVIALFAHLDPVSHDIRLFLTTGLIGGFTTWSTFTLDVVTLWERGETAAAAAYVLASLFLSLFVIAVVLALARRWL